MITTSQPTDDMIEVAIVSLEEALVADGESVPVGSAEFERSPMVIGRVPVESAAPVDAVAPLPAAPLAPAVPLPPPAAIPPVDPRP